MIRSFGLVLNRKSGGKVGELIVADMPDALRDQAVYLGGPVQASALTYLHSDPSIAEGNVLSNVGLGRRAIWFFIWSRRCCGGRSC
jgi:putative AlgH/UPF0301 family transcriptional regulator